MGRVCVFVSSVWAEAEKKKRLTYHFHKRRVSACDSHSDWQVRRAVYASKDTRFIFIFFNAHLLQKKHRLDLTSMSNLCPVAVIQACMY